MKFECVFLDRDGVINQERADYVKSWEEFALLPGSLEALSRLAFLDVPIILVTNQSAIGRGAAHLDDIKQIHQKLSALTKENGGRIDDIFLCPHRPDEHCACRKPKPGMLFQAATKYALHLERCIFVGDSITDFQAAQAAGCRSILVKSGRQARELESLVALHMQNDRSATKPEIVDNFGSAVERILTIHTSG